MTHPLTASLVAWAGRNFSTWGEAIRWLRAREPQADRPTFSTADQVLWWAFGNEIPTTKTTGVFKMAGRARDDLWQDEETKERAKSAPIRTRAPEIDRRPTGRDAVIQQAMILNFIYKLPMREQLYILAKYAPRARYPNGETKEQWSKARSKGEFRRGPTNECAAARCALRDVLIPLLDSSIRPRYATYALICAHFGRKVDRDELAARIEYMFPAKRAAQDARGAIRRLANNIDSLLKDMAASADGKCHEHFQQGGLIK